MMDQESRPELKEPELALGREIEPCGGRSNLAGIGQGNSAVRVQVQTSSLSRKSSDSSWGKERALVSPCGGGHVRRESGSSRGLAWILVGGATYESRRERTPLSGIKSSSPLSIPRPGPMIHPRGLSTSGESKPESPLLTPSHQISRRLFPYKRKRISHLVERNQHEHHLQTLPNQIPPKKHTQDLRLFRCELSKVA